MTQKRLLNPAPDSICPIFIVCFLKQLPETLFYHYSNMLMKEIQRKQIGKKTGSGDRQRTKWREDEEKVIILDAVYRPALMERRRNVDVPGRRAAASPQRVLFLSTRSSERSRGVSADTKTLLQAFRHCCQWQQGG